MEHPIIDADRYQYKMVVRSMTWSWIVLFVITMLASCYYDVEEELYGTLDCSTAGVTYSGEVLSIISANCYTCHDAASNFGNITLEGYDNLKKYADSGQLLGAIKREPGFSPMPRNAAPLLDCDIAKIEKWIADGALNN